MATAPSGLTATATSSSQVDLEWTGSGAPETYRVERSDDGGASWLEIAFGVIPTDREDNGLQGATAYRYRVRAEDDLGLSGYSNTATATTDAAPVVAPLAPSGPTTGRYVIVAVEPDGTPIARFPQAQVGSVAWTLNEWPTMAFDVPNNHPRIAEIQAVTTQVQLWRDGKFLDWFVPLRPQGKSPTTNFGCNGLLWWLDRRHIGKADRKNWLPTLDNGITAPYDPYTGWSTVGVSTYRNSDIGFPPPSVMLQQANADTDTFIHYIANVSSAPGGRAWTITAWVHIGSDTRGMTFPSNIFARAYEQRGLHVSVIADGNNLLSTKFEPLSPEAGHLQPSNHKLEVRVDTPEGFVGHIEVRLYAPRGRTFWDTPKMTLDESLVFSHRDQVDIIKGLVTHAQDTAFGKTSLGFAQAGARRGVVRSISYSHADHQNVWGEIKKLTELENGPDIELVCTPTTKTFWVHDPARGTVKNEIVYRWDTKSIIDYAWDQDGLAALDRIIALGEGTGPDREEGYYVDPTAWENNALEGIVASPETDMWWLDLKAEQSVKRRSDVTVGTITVPAEGTIGRVKPGDYIPIEISDGWTQVTGLHRVVQMQLNPVEDTLDLSVNTLVPT